MLRFAALTTALLVVACKPPATEEYSGRELPEQREAPSEPLDSPDTSGAIWAPSEQDGRIIYGKPGERPLFALACLESEAGNTIEFTRYARADAGAKAMLSLIGNRHVARYKIDAVERGEAWLWQGSISAEDPGLDALTGQGEVEATVPGAGSLILNPSRLPGMLVTRCRPQSLLGDLEVDRSEEDLPEAPQ